jgi:hypothetical protein
VEWEGGSIRRGEDRGNAERAAGLPTVALRCSQIGQQLTGLFGLFVLSDASPRRFILLRLLCDPPREYYRGLHTSPIENLRPE